MNNFLPGARLVSLPRNSEGVRFQPGMFAHLKEIGVDVDERLVRECEDELTKFNEKVSHRYENYLGYPNSILAGFLPQPILSKLLLNIGDWRGNRYLGPNTHGYEEEATEYLKEIFDFPVGRREWGNSCTGSSEAVLAGIVYGRSLLKAKNGKMAVVLASEECHYSARKNAHIAGLDFISVKTGDRAGMDLLELRNVLDALAGVPVIVVASCGTTVREGFDPIRGISDLLDYHHGGSYIHVDAALSGFTMPFFEDVDASIKPRFFRNVGSISVSLHKFMGVNRPSAMILGIDRACDSLPLRQRVEYIDATDGTPSGSRNGHPVLAFAMLYRIIGRDGFKLLAEDCRRKAKYLSAKLRAEGIDVFHNEGALTVYMPRPSEYIVNKYTLACSGNGAHVITMLHVTYELLDRFIADYLDWYRSRLI